MTYTITRLAETGSTNAIARQMAAQGAPEGTVVTADRQTAGRGRMGRTFHSPEGSGLYMSLILRPMIPAAQAIRITTAAAVAVSRALEKMGCAPQIKWVNDIYARGRKICGILAESALAADGTMAYAVLGIGVNLAAPAGGFPPEIAEIAGAAFDNPPPDAREKLLAAILGEFAPLYADLAGECAAHMAEYRRRCFLIGKAITVMPLDGGAPYDAVAADVDDECGLVIRLPDGTAQTLSSAEVRVRGK